MQEPFEMTLEEAFEDTPTILNNLTLDNAEQTTTFRNIFRARWDIYQVAGDSIEEFQKFIENKFTAWKPYYQELIDDYENQITYMNGIVSSETHNEDYSAEGNVTKDDTYGKESVYSELPNRTTTGTYPTNKTVDTDNFDSSQEYTDEHNKDVTITRTGDVNILDQKIKYQKYLRNVYLEFANKFEECFVLVY